MAKASRVAAQTANTLQELSQQVAALAEQVAEIRDALAGKDIAVTLDTVPDLDSLQDAIARGVEAALLQVSSSLSRSDVAVTEGVQAQDEGHTAIIDTPSGDVEVKDSPLDPSALKAKKAAAKAEKE